MKGLLFTLFLIAMLCSCNAEEKMERALQTVWAVDQCMQLETNENIQFGVNLMSFDTNYSCSMPAFIGKKRSLAEWNLEKRGHEYFLKISRCAQELFNGNYKLNYERHDGINRMTLTSSKIEMICTSMQ